MVRARRALRARKRCTLCTGSLGACFRGRALGGCRQRRRLGARAPPRAAAASAAQEAAHSPVPKSPVLAA